MVKANAYGLGVRGVSKALWAEGCRDFFVATLEEAIELREILPKAGIGVFQGLFVGEEKEYTHYNLIPVLNDLSQVERFIKSEIKSKILHVDTGMTRLGLCESELQNPILTRLQTPSSRLTILSHLACANDPTHYKNYEQLERFHTALKYFPAARASLANSAGVFLPTEFHFDIARTGCAIYGINPTDGKRAMHPVVNLSAPILQIRTLDRDETIGYGATADATRSSLIAIVGMGYADGYSRILGNQGFAFVDGYKVRLIGRVSMDMVALDVSSIPESQINIGSHAEFINHEQTVDDIARQCNTIGYEILTRIGNRVNRIYS